jgi:hypothetical protein
MAISHNLANRNIDPVSLIIFFTNGYILVL